MIKDSGERREFCTGAVRDMAEGKGRFDLVPLDVLAELMPHDNKVATNGFLYWVSAFIENGDEGNLFRATWCAIDATGKSPWECALDLAVHFENGAKKYGEYNWQKGIEARSYIDSAVRHYCKYEAGFEDEPHATACLWNLVCCLWTIRNKPELNSFSPKSRCVETTCYYNDDCFCRAEGKGEPEKGKDCHLFSED